MHLKRTFDFSSFTVLICTPSDFARGLMSDMCRALRFKAVLSKRDFTAAWNAFTNNPIDIMFGDVVAEDGYRLLKEARDANVSPNPHIPYIATALASSSSCIARARDTGATEFLRFPLSAETLIERVVHVVDCPRTFVKSPGYTGPRQTAQERGVSRGRSTQEGVRGSGRRAYRPRSRRKSQRMTTRTDVVFVKVANTLKRRAERGRGITIEDMLQAADKVVESHTKTGRDQMLAAIFDARATVANWKTDGDRESLISKLRSMANEAENQGLVLGNPLLTEVGVRLAAFVSLFANGRAAPSAKATIAIELHLDAMVVALDRRRDAIDKVGRTLLDNLELTQHTLKPSRTQDP